MNNYKIKWYQKKPVKVQAIQWNGNNLNEIIQFTGWHESASSKWTWEQYEEIVRKNGLKIFTLEGSYIAPIGSFIIKGVRGEFYPCDPNIFLETYDEVDQ